MSNTGTGGTPGQKGQAIVMVSNGGAGGASHFDCIMESFQDITGASTGIFNIDFEEVSGGVVWVPTPTASGEAHGSGAPWMPTQETRLPPAAL